MALRYLARVGVGALVVVFAGACGGGDQGAVEVPGEDSFVDTAPDGGWNWDTAPTDTVPQPDIGEDAAGEDLPGDLQGDMQPTDLPPETWTPTPCSSHSDCDEGLCIEHPPGSGSSADRLYAECKLTTLPCAFHRFDASGDSRSPTPPRISAPVVATVQVRRKVQPRSPTF